MPRLLSDPNLSFCPNYADDAFINTRLQLTNENITEAQAIVILRNIWQAENNATKLQWQAQVNEDRDRREQLERLDNEEQERQEQESRDEEEAARKEDRKKNKHKYTAVPDLDVPLKPTILPSSYALRKLDKGDYVELWYFTNDGLDEAKLKSSVDEDAMIMATLAGGDTAWVSAASTRNARAVIDDQNLRFEDFCQACPRIIEAMQEAAWPADRIQMMALFWRNLQVHDFRSMRDPLAQKALLVYQAEQRKRWHIAVKSARGAYDLSRINEVLLERTRSDIYLEERTKLDNKRDYKMDHWINLLAGGASSNYHHKSRDNHHSTKEQRRRSRSPNQEQEYRRQSPPPDSHKRSRQDFRSSANRGPLSACAVCLGRHPHKVIECKATKTWDNVADTLCSRVGKLLNMRDGRAICSDWQRVAGCSDTSHDRRHFCSGCTSSSHGAQNCPRAQKA